MAVCFYRDPVMPFWELKMCAGERLAFKKHYHEDFSLGLVENGASVFWHEGRQTEVQTGALVLIPPLVLHACNPREERGWRYKMLFLRPDWVQGLCGERPVRPEAARCLAGRSGPLLMGRLVDCLTGAATPLEKETRLMDALTPLLADGDGRETSAPAREGTGLKRAKAYLEAFYRERLSLATLEEVSGLSKFYLVRLFKKRYGVPPHMYQTALRVNFAQRELRRCRCVAEVAQDAGFYDQSHFVKTFKNHVGVTPEFYRDAH